MMTIDDELLMQLPPMPWRVTSFNNGAILVSDDGCIMGQAVGDILSDRMSGQLAAMDLMAAVSQHFAPHQAAVLEARAKMGDPK